MGLATWTAALVLLAPAAGSATCSSNRHGVALGLFAASIAAPLAGNVAGSASHDALGRGLSIFAGDGAGIALAATGAAVERGCRADEAPRWPLWWSGFAPAVASAALMDVVDPDHRQAVLAAGTAASIAWFGVVAFTDLGYGRPASRAAPAVVAAPAPMRLGEGWAPGLTVSGRF